MTENTMDLFCDNVASVPADYDWSEGYGEAWRICRPDFWNMEAAELFEYADDYGISLTDDPRELSRAELIEGLESIGVACYNFAYPEISPPGTSIVVLISLADGEPWYHVSPEDYVDTKNQLM